MARDVANRAKKTYGESQDLYNTSTANAQGLYNQLVPTFTQEATNPQGYGKTDLAAMNTAAQQSAGGGVGAAVGEAGTKAAANRNLGSFAPALDEASRGATRTLGQEALNTQVQNAGLKERQRQAGISGLSGLQSQQNEDIMKSLGLSNQSANLELEAGKSGWFQNMVNLINAISGAGKAYAAGGGKFGGGGGGGGGSWDPEASSIGDT
jgi:hypothetical protein